MTGPSRYDQFIPGGVTRQEPRSRYDAFVPQETEEEKRQREEREARERRGKELFAGAGTSGTFEGTPFGERYTKSAKGRALDIAANIAGVGRRIGTPGLATVETALRGAGLQQRQEITQPRKPSEYLAQFAGEATPDIAATLMGGQFLRSLAGGTGPISGAARTILGPQNLSGNVLQRGGQILRQNIGSAVAAAPLVTVPGAIAGGRQSLTGGLAQMSQAAGGERGIARRAVEQLAETVPGRLAGDIALDVLPSTALESAGRLGIGAMRWLNGPSILPVDDATRLAQRRAQEEARIAAQQARAEQVLRQAAGDEPIVSGRLSQLQERARRQAERGGRGQGPIDINARLQLLKDIREMRGEPPIEVVPAVGGNVVRQQEDAAARAARQEAERVARRQRTFQTPDEEATARLEEAAKGMKSRAGFADPMLFSTAARTAVGGAGGFAIGDTPEERLAYGFAGATGAFVAPNVIRRIVRPAEIPITDPTTNKLLSVWERANPKVEALAEEFIGGKVPRPLARATMLDIPFAKRIADWYDSATSNPDDPAVQAAYRAFADETRRQFEFLKSKGIKFEFVDTDPYKTSAEMMQDVAENNRLKVLKTEAGMHPLLSEEENDMFRAVHDFFGHAKEGHQFGQLGEENAYRVHSAMYSPEARRVMATETRGQNSWVNNQPANKVKPGSVYAEQKVALMPEEFMGEYPIERVTPEVVTNVEMQSNKMPGLRDADVKAWNNINRIFGRAAFIRKVVEPIVKSEGLPVSVARGLGSWLSNENAANITEAARLTFDEMSPMAIQRVLSRVSQAAKQMGLFFAVPNPNGEAVSLTLDFGKSLKESDYRSAVERLAALDGGRLFSGTTMVKLNPAKVQIVLNRGVDEQGAESLLDLAREALPQYNTKGVIQRVDRVESEDANALNDAFLNYFNRIGYLTPEQAQVQQQAINAYEQLAQAGPVGRALAAGPSGIIEGVRGVAGDALRRMAKATAGYSPIAGGREGVGDVGAGATPVGRGGAQPVAGEVGDGEAYKNIAGKVYDVTGAIPEALRSPIGQQILRKGGVYGAGEITERLGEGGETYDESPFLRETGRAMKGLALASSAYPVVKAGARYGGVKLRDVMAQTPQGRFVLNSISRDILIDPRIKEAVQNTIEEIARYRAIGRELAAEARKLGPAGDRLISDLVEMEKFENVILDPNEMATAMALANRIADAVEGLGLGKVEQRLISQQTFEKRNRSYLVRKYARYAGEEAMAEAPPGAQAQPFRIKGEKQRLDLSPEQRNELGEIREASYRLAETFGRGGKDVATARMFVTLSDIPGVIEPQYKQLFEEMATARGLRDAALETGDKEAAKDASRAYLEAKNALDTMRETFKRGDEFITLPDTPGLGVLRGAVVKRDVAEYLLMVDDWADTKHVWDKALNAWKKIHTVYNPGTHSGNFISNGVMTHLAGIPLMLQPFYMRAAVKDLQEYGPATRYLTEKGILERGLPLYGVTPVKGLAEDKTALRTLARTTRPETRAALKAQGIEPMSTAELLAREAEAKVVRTYSLEDGVYRVMLFQRNVEKGMSPEEALKKTMEALPGYDTRSPILKALKKTFSPFVLFPAKYIPAALNMILEHPERWVGLAALWGGLNEASRRLYEPLEQKDLPPNQRGYNYLIPGRIQVDAIARPAFELLGIEPPTGDKYTFDVARWTPFSAVTGSPAPGMVGSQLDIGLPLIAQPSGPLVDIGALALGVNPFTGEKTIEPGMTAGEKAKALGLQAASLVLPSAAAFQTPRVIEDILRRDPAAAAVDMMGLLGLRPQVIRPGMEEWRQQKKYEEAVNGIKTRLERELRKNKNPERAVRLEEDAAKAILREEQKFMRAITVRVPR